MWNNLSFITLILEVHNQQNHKSHGTTWNLTNLTIKTHILPNLGLGSIHKDAVMTASYQACIHTLDSKYTTYHINSIPKTFQHSTRLIHLLIYQFNFFIQNKLIYNKFKLRNQNIFLNMHIIYNLLKNNTLTMQTTN